MIEVDVKNVKGEKVEKIKLSEKVFDLKLNEQLLRNVYEAKRASGRKVIAHTKERSERRGGGSKPWRQKGTGRARHGTIRSPLWKKGGVTFGPRKERNYKQKVNKKVNRKAIFVALSEKLRKKRLVVIDSFTLDKPKTKLASQVLVKLLPKTAKDVLVILTKNQAAIRATRNIKIAKAIRAENINIIDLLNFDGVIFDKEAIENFQK